MTWLASKPDEIGQVTGSVWATTRLNLPGASSGEKYRNVFTGEIVEVKEQAGKPILELSEVLEAFPVALLEKTNR